MLLSIFLFYLIPIICWLKQISSWLNMKLYNYTRGRMIHGRIRKEKKIAIATDFIFIQCVERVIRKLFAQMPVYINTLGKRGRDFPFGTFGAHLVSFIEAL
jgi:hypothetical protein